MDLVHKYHRSLLILKGRITNAVNVAISTSLSIVGGSGTGSVNLLVDGLTFVDGDFVNTSVAGTSVTIGLDATAIIILLIIWLQETVLVTSLLEQLLQL